MKDEDVQKIIAGLSTNINELVKESVYEQSKSKDVEVSGLHRQIIQKLGDVETKVDNMKTTLDNHDIVIRTLQDIYRSSSIIKKIIISLVLGIPALGAFLAGLGYLEQVVKDHLAK